jgi:hypothetical protein
MKITSAEANLNNIADDGKRLMPRHKKLIKHFTNLVVDRI